MEVSLKVLAAVQETATLVQKQLVRHGICDLLVQVGLSDCPIHNLSFIQPP